MQYPPVWAEQGTLTVCHPIGDQFCDGADTSMVNAHDLREKDPQCHRSAVNSCGSKNGVCFTKDRLDSLFGNQRREVQVATLACVVDSIAKRIKRLMAHGGLPCSTCLGGEIPKLIASEAPCCQSKLNLDGAIACRRLIAIRSWPLFGEAAFRGGRSRRRPARDWRRIARRFGFLGGRRGTRRRRTLGQMV